MNPNDTPNPHSRGGENVADRNVERLLTDAYRPQEPDPAFVEKATAAMQAAARRRPATPASARRRRTLRRLLGWAVAATLLVAAGGLLGHMLLGKPDFRREGAVVWIDGKPYKPADAPSGGTPWRKIEPEELAKRAEGPEGPLGSTGLRPRARKEAAPAETLAVGTLLETAAGQRRRATLADGSVLYVNHDTALSLDRPRQLTLHRGEIYIEVAPAADDAKATAAGKFVVHTPGRRITALGTKFNVRVTDEGTGVVVTQGKVEVSGMKLPLWAGQQLAPQNRETLESVPPVSAAPRATHLLDWTRDLMARAESPLVPASKYSGGALIAKDPSGQEAKLSLRKYHVDVHIEDGFARTTIDQTYFNHLTSRLEGTFYFPLPPDASLSRLAMYVSGKLMEGGMAEREHARRVFEDIVRKMKDPALLEWIDGSTFKMRVFPLEGRQEKRIIISYTQRLPSLYSRTQYRFPGGHSMQRVGQWSAHVRVKGGVRARWESDSHDFVASKEGRDLLLDVSASNVKPDQDVVLSLHEKKSRKRGRPSSGSDAAGPSPRPSPDGRASFSSAVHEGSKYLMLRWRPDLSTKKGRERRDWVFLFEASADRDPLLARVQLDVIKTLLENAEHDDTFSILTAGTRVHAFRAKPQVASPKNLKKAVKFLEQTHLVGALDLERAFAATRPFVDAVDNPYLVHVGSGLPVLGEKDVPGLVRRIPEAARYVGVGVGKRWSRTLMKTAANRSGGYFTQINPDEQITWRALDLLSTLNTPRLMNVNVADDAEQLEFLCYSDSLAHGEELCAITRFDEGSELPDKVEVSGMIHGELLTETVAVEEVNEGADYLPRIWAKLEIDRLVALGALENKARIIELSKAMYVMSPFTSLLVLENEQMYQQYNVDRGRKDHWALYPCPEKIPVVHEPLPSLVGPEAPEGPAGQKPTAAEVLSTVMLRIPPQVLEWPKRPQRQTAYAVPILYLFPGHFAARYRYGPVGTTAGEFGGMGGFGMGMGGMGMGGMGMGGFGGMGGWRYFPQGFAPVTGFLVNGLGRDGSWSFDLNGNGDYDDADFQRMLLMTGGRITWDNDGDGIVRLWDVQTGQTLPSLHRPDLLHFWAHQRPGYSLAFSPDGRTLATGSYDSMVRLWNAWGNGSGLGTIAGSGTLRSTGPVDIQRLIGAVNRRVPPGGHIEATMLSDFGIDLPPVQIEMLDGLNMLVLRGHQRDVDRTMRIIKEIELLGSEAGPRAHVSQLMGRFDSLMREDRHRIAEEAMRLRVLRQKAIVDALFEVEKSHVPFPDEPPIFYPEAEIWEELTARRNEKYGDMMLSTRVYPVADLVLPVGTPRYRSMDLASRGSAETKIYEALKSPTQLEFDETPLWEVADYLKDYHDIEIQIDRKALDNVGIAADAPITKNLKGISLRSALRLMLRDLDLTYVIQDELLLITTPEEFVARLRDRESRVALPWYRMKTGQGRGWLNYEQPSFQNHWSTYHDLLSHAPGMNTSPADVCAVLEAEARAHEGAATGRIDTKARRLINKARAHGWQTATITDRKGKVLLTVDFDGTGRYRYERTTTSGLREQVVCDGTHLWHLYPELGLGARRTASRFHRRHLAGLVPWGLPPAEDLARGADLMAVDERTVAIAPQGIEELKDDEGKPIKYARVHMLFAPDGRLAERRLVEVPSGKTLLRQTYAADGTMKWLDAEEKVLAERKIDLSPCGAPDLKPDEKELVILPMPWRSLNHVYQSRNLNDRYETWSEEDALAGLAAYLAAQRHEARLIIGRRFFKRGDRRLGFYALLIAGGHTWDPAEKQDFVPNVKVLCDPLADHPDEPLAQYVAAYLKLRQGKAREFGPIGGRQDGLLRQLAEFRDLWMTFQSGQVKKAGKAELEQYRDRTLSFLRHRRSPELAWALLSIALDNDTFSGFYRQFGRSCEDFQHVPGLWYVARYEYARAMQMCGNVGLAQELFTKLHADTIKAGFLPPVDSSFRDAFQRDGNSRKKWRELMRETSEKLIADGARPAAVRLAWQVHHLGDRPLAEELFSPAVSGTPKPERLRTTLAAVEYLHSAGQHARAGAMLRPLLENERYAGWPSLWRLAAVVADARGMTARALGHLERAMQIEYERLPETFNVQPIRNEYSQLLSRYQQLAASLATLQPEPPREFLARVIRAADRWRSLDTDPTAACHAAAKIFGDLGAAELAWDYLTTPLAAKPNEAAPWLDLAKMLRQQGHFELADRAYASAFEAEPTNAQILWDRAQVLLEAGHTKTAEKLLHRLAEGKWQPQFQQLQARAKQHVEEN